jgi:hypothetical protein
LAAEGTAVLRQVAKGLVLLHLARLQLVVVPGVVAPMAAVQAVQAVVLDGWVAAAAAVPADKVIVVVHTEITAHTTWAAEAEVRALLEEMEVVVVMVDRAEHGLQTEQPMLEAAVVVEQVLATADLVEVEQVKLEVLWVVELPVQLILEVVEAVAGLTLTHPHPEQMVAQVL